MVNIVPADSPAGPSPPETPSTRTPADVVGEIDTTSPFQSVKAALGLFRDVSATDSPPPSSRSRLPSHDMLEKETQLVLAEEEMQRVQWNLESAEAAKAHTFSDLKSAQRRAADLRASLEATERSKRCARDAKEAMDQRYELLEVRHLSISAEQSQELETAREDYILLSADLDMAKQELAEITSQFNLSMEAKLGDLQKAEDELVRVEDISHKIKGMSKEISEMNDTIKRLQLETERENKEADKISMESAAARETYAAMKQESEKRLEDLKRDYNPELRKHMEETLAEISADIESLKEEIKQAQSVKLMRDELNEAKNIMQTVSDEECSYRSLVSSIMVELDRVQREKREAMGKEDERQGIEEQEWLEASRKVEEILSEAEKTRKEAEEMNRNVHELRREAETTRSFMTEIVKQLEVVSRAVEKAKAAEKRAMEDMRVLAEKQESLTNECDKKIRISMQEFEDLRGKREESEKLVEFKAKAVDAQLKEIHQSRIEAEKKLEANMKALEEIKAATNIAWRSAEIAEAAQTAVDAELKKWRPEEM